MIFTLAGKDEELGYRWLRRDYSIFIVKAIRDLYSTERTVFLFYSLRVFLTVN